MTPAEGEIIVDLTRDALRVGDGLKAGGFYIPNFLDIYSQEINYVTITGTANALIATSTFPLLAYSAGVKICFIAGADNTAGGTAIDVDGIGSVAMQKRSGNTLVDLDAFDLTSGCYYEAIHNGTVFQLLNPPAPAPTPSGLVLLDEKTASASSSLDFTSVISSTYSNYILDINDLYMSASNAEMRLRFSSNNGSSWLTSGYFIGTAAKGELPLTAATLGWVAPSSSSPLSSRVELFSLPQAKPSRVMINSIWAQNATASTQQFLNSMGGYLSATAINAIQVYPASGTITDGTARLYGISE